VKEKLAKEERKAQGDGGSIKSKRRGMTLTL